MMVRQTTNNSFHEEAQYSINEILALNTLSTLCSDRDPINNTNTYPLQEAFNIQLSYDIN